MSIILDDLTDKIAARVRIEREARKWSLADVAEHSGVSKAMISKIERGESSPTMTVLGRLCGAFGLTLSTFLTRAEDHSGRLIRASEQPSWTDPETGCVRSLISPGVGGPIEIVVVDLPAGAEVMFPASIYAVFHQIVWRAHSLMSTPLFPMGIRYREHECICCPILNRLINSGGGSAPCGPSSG